MAASVWVIERGDHDEYRVIGVFSTRRNAEQVLAALDRDPDGLHEPTIAEWPLDPAVSEIRAGLLQWRVLMLRDGTVERVERVALPAPEGLAGHTRIWRRSRAPDVADRLWAVVWARDERHAVEIANEQRARMIESGEW